MGKTLGQKSGATVPLTLTGSQTTLLMVWLVFSLHLQTLSSRGSTFHTAPINMSLYKSFSSIDKRKPFLNVLYVLVLRENGFYTYVGRTQLLIRSSDSHH
jgi:hypothetical protein